MKTHFKAPWGTGLKWSSALVTLFALAIMLSGFPMQNYRFPTGSWTPLLWQFFPALVLVGSLPFIVRGYTITNGTLHVHRLLWVTKIPLTGLQSAEIIPDSLCGSLRTCGNGGLYSYTGRYWNKRLGHYRAFVNDWKRPVVLRWPNKTIVLSCEEPEAFVSAVTPP